MDVIETKALRIEHDLSGPIMRAGGLNPRDGSNFLCPTGWKHYPDGIRGVEIWLVVDRDVERFHGVDGVTVLSGESEIDAAVAAIQPTKPTYKITAELLLVEHIRQSGIDITDLGPDMEGAEVAQALHAKGCVGVCRCHTKKPLSCREFHKRLAASDAASAANKRGPLQRGRQTP